MSHGNKLLLYFCINIHVWILFNVMQCIDLRINKAPSVNLVDQTLKGIFKWFTKTELEV